MRKFVFLLAVLLPTAVQAQPARPAPKLIVAISVDQLSSDLWDEYRPMFGGGLARLARGTAYRNGYQGHAATETCPGHSTILTGSRPSRTGIIANNWHDLSQTRSDKSVYCAEDERVQGTSSLNYKVSPIHLKVPTLGELMKQRTPASRNVAVAGKDRSAVMMGGQVPDQRWYWDGKAFVTDLKSAAVPKTLPAVNTAVAAAIAAPQTALTLPPLCTAKSRVVPIQGGGKPVGAGTFARAAGDARGFRASPAFDGATLALAAALFQEMQLGRGAATDILSIGLAATDFVGHSYGTEGAEMCLQLFSLDRDLGDFFGVLDRSGVDYAVVLTADHGGQDIPERLREQGFANAARVDPALAASAIGKAVGAKLGLSGPVLIGESSFGDIYLDRALRSADRARALAAAVADYRAHPQVEAAYTSEQLRRTPSPTNSPDKWSLIERARASFDETRSGDFIVLLKPRITPIPDTRFYVATHGSPWDYDRRVPILFWRPGMAPVARDTAIETVDIMPTLAAMIGLPVQPGSIDGKCLAGVEGIVCPTR
jgi:predicted AlkP superfamily pyrophosphatase or phosphodiesterase